MGAFTSIGTLGRRASDAVKGRASLLLSFRLTCKTRQESDSIIHNESSGDLLSRLGSDMLGSALQIGKLMQTAPLRVISFVNLRALGHLPRSTRCPVCGCDHIDLLEHADSNWDFSLTGKPIVMISHSWIRASEGMPDDSANRKHAIVVAGVEELCKRHKIAEERAYVFLDWISIPQEALKDGIELFYKYVTSLPAFVAQMAFVLVPLDSSLLMSDAFRVDPDGNHVQMNWQHYSARGWCRAEMLAGRAMAACGTGVRVYRCDASRPGPPRLVEVPPYTGASRSLLPTADDALYSCCQADHYDPKTKKRFACDRESVQDMEFILRETVRHHQRHGRRKLYERYPLDHDEGHKEGLPALEARVFLECGKLPQLSDPIVKWYSDDALKHKVVFYFIDQAWEGDDYAWHLSMSRSWPIRSFMTKPNRRDENHSLKHRWMSSVLERLTAREGIEKSDCLVFLSAWCGQYTMMKITPAQVIVRVTYVVVFNLSGDGSHNALECALIRLELFVARLVAAAGIYNAVFESRLIDRQSLADMTCELIDVGDLSGLHKVEDYEGTDDFLCPWTGEVSDERLREEIKAKTLDILSFAITLKKKDVVALREQLLYCSVVYL